MLVFLVFFIKIMKKTERYSIIIYVEKQKRSLYELKKIIRK